MMEIQCIGDGWGRLRNGIKKKIREDALFSDKAIKQVRGQILKE